MQSTHAPESSSLDRRRNFSQIYHFLGKRVIRLLAASVFLGIFAFLVEFAFANALQAFLLTLGALRAGDSYLPAWFPVGSLGGVLTVMAIAGVFRGITIWAQQYMQSASKEEFLFLMRNRILRWSYHSESVSSKEVMTLFGEFTVNSGELILCLQTIVVQGTLGAFLLAIMLRKSFLLTVALLALLLPLIFPIRKMSRRIEIAGRAFTAEWQRLNANIAISIKNLLLMQIYGTQRSEEEKSQQSLLRFYRENLVRHMLAAIKMALPQTVGVVIVCSVSYFVLTRQLVLAGIFITYLYLFMRFIQTVSQLNFFASYYFANGAQLGILFNWWREKSNDGPSVHIRPVPPQQVSLPPGTPGWKIRGLTYTYPGATKPIMENLNLDVKPRSTLVISGTSGAGKSTLLNLMIGGARPDSGSIELLFQDEALLPLSMARSGLLQRLGYVGPESFLIEGSILDNVTYGLERVPTHEELQSVLGKAECQFVFSFPEGIHHKLTDQGQGLSAGQKQRIALARALLRRPQVLVLDEATANLDAETESNLLNTLQQMKGEMTIVAVSHRPAFLSIADQSLELK